MTAPESKTKPNKSGDAINNLSFAGLSAKGKSKGPTEPFKIDIKKLIEDEQNVRQHFDEQSIEELAASIKTTDGLLSPISVKPHPDQDGMYLINHGARRFRACKLLGLKEVAVQLNVNHEMFAQVIENVQRENLTELEISRFIERAEAEGLSSTEIATSLGKSISWVSRHKNLHLAPEPILAAIDSQQLSGAETIKAMTVLMEDKPDVAQALLDSDQPITQKKVREARKSDEGSETKPLKPKAPVKAKVSDDTVAQSLQNAPDSTIIDQDDATYHNDFSSLGEPNEHLTDATNDVSDPVPSNVASDDVVLDMVHGVSKIIDSKTDSVNVNDLMNILMRLSLDDEQIALLIEVADERKDVTLRNLIKTLFNKK